MGQDGNRYGVFDEEGISAKYYRDEIEKKNDPAFIARFEKICERTRRGDDHESAELMVDFPTAVFRHYKGGIYFLIDEEAGQCEERGLPLTRYMNQDGVRFLRPRREFFGRVCVAHGTEPLSPVWALRFQPLKLWPQVGSGG